MVWIQQCVITHNIQQEIHDICRKCEINVTVGNGQKTKFKIEVSVKMNMQGGEKGKLTEVL